MRGGDNRTGKLFSYVDLEARVRRDHPLRAIRTMLNEALSALQREFAATLFADWAAVDPAGEAAAGGVLFDPLGAASDGAAGVRPAVPLVRRNRRRRRSLGPFGVLEEPRPSAGRRIAAKFLAAVLAQPKVKKLLSSDYFSVDGALIKAWASIKGVNRRTVLAPRRRKTAAAMPKRISMARNFQTTPMRPPPIPTLGSTARVRARRPSYASLEMGRWRTAMPWWSMRA